MVSSILSICFMCLIFSLHVGFIPTVRMILSLLIVAPLCIAISLLPCHIYALSFVCLYGLAILVLWRCCYASECFSRLWKLFVYPFERMQKYCQFGKAGVSDPVRGSLMVWIHLLFAGAPIIAIIFSILPPTKYVRSFSLLFVLGGACLVVYVLRVVVASRRDLQKLAVWCHHLCYGFSYPAIAYYLICRLFKCSESFPESWSPNLFTLVFRVVLPFLCKLRVTVQVGQLATALSLVDAENCFVFRFMFTVIVVASWKFEKSPLSPNAECYLVLYFN